ncbi:MAG: septum formation initiator family protein [Lentisphaeria bacterium]|nr:septum formation initiator family protein [Lentisphaeria bacterium]
MGKVLTSLVYLLLALVLIISGLLVLPAYRKYRQTEQEVETLQADLDRVKAEYLTIQQEVHDLQHNASAVEKVAREQYHLCRDGEVIYIYSE